MSGSSKPVSESFEDESLDSALDDMVRAVARAPSRTPPPDAHGGTRWGEGGRYVVEKRLGRGGMGTVYLAADTLLGRQVAIKVLHVEEHGDDPAKRSRLVREARLAAGLEHERIARVYDVEEHEGTTFVAMEYVRGATLRTWVGDAPGPEHVGRLLREIAEGLAVLHAAGVVHRDLKPENVMLSATGGIKLLDFGLAGIFAATPDAARSAVEGAGTSGQETSALHGTLGYMAPEQCDGQRADARADVFALGVIAYELVTGERPFRGATREMSRKAVEVPPRFEESTWKRYAPGLVAIVSRMLRVDRSARYADGTEVLRALEEVFRPAVARPSRRTVVAIGAALGIAALGAVAFPQARRRLALRSALTHAPPPGMALINEGTLTVGQAREVADRECAELGARCNANLIGYQVPSRQVEVGPFYLDTHEVTNRELAAVLDDLRNSLFAEIDEDDHTARHVRFNAGLGRVTGHLVDLEPDMGGILQDREGRYRPRPGRAEWPANQVTWFGAHLYCESVGKRLPTEDEWEAAARGHANRPFPWGEEPPRCGAVVVPSDGFLPMKDECHTLAGPKDVGTATLDVSPQGVHDLGGNVTEWVDSVFAIRDGASAPPASNVDGPRVLRGASFFYSLPARTSFRTRRPPAYLAFDVGFRCASDLSVSTPHS